MKKSFATLGLAAVLLASCSTPMFGPHAGSHANPKTIIVMVKNGKIEVPQDPAGVLEENGVIKWVLDDPAKYRFPASPDNGIEFKRSSANPPNNCKEGDASQAFANCGRKRDGKEFHCSKVGSHVKGICYAYAVRLDVVPGSGAKGVLPLDPWIISE